MKFLSFALQIFSVNIRILPAVNELRSRRSFPTSSKAFLTDLHGAVLDLLDLEGVDDPHGEVTEKKEGDHLTAWFVRVLAAGRDATALSVGNEQELEQDLKK